MKLFTNYSLLYNNTFHLDVKAARYIEYETIGELRHVSCVMQHEQLLHIGSGSNLLFTGDFSGTILHSTIRYIEIVAETSDTLDVRVGAGLVWDDFVAYSVTQNWQGAENLSQIPGEVGAAAVQNIGAYGMEVKDLIVSVETMDMATGQIQSFNQPECRYSYRSSIFKHEWKGRYTITGVVFRLQKKPLFNLTYGQLEQEVRKLGEVTAANIRKAVISIRERKLPNPTITGNAGSFFMNPVVSEVIYHDLLKDYPDMPCYKQHNSQVKIPAGWLIEQCGWKGRAIGRAAVHDKQALVLINTGGATGTEILQLAKMIQLSVIEKFGIHILPEVNII
ncbi:MAG: UDP-N-acetylmuramate dehydrogenase [Bacteroidales bacterium]|jgi:UDP-N-acetylmuramate dehydrogenase|nr:UDP-N-acetylmuramate dehydrogenase [Bacteroidales bacterium]